MASTYILWRGGRQIEIQKEEEYFTAILPNSEIVKEVYSMDAVEDMQPVFSNIFRVKTSGEELDRAMQVIRNQMNGYGVSHHAYHPVGDHTTRYYLTDKLIVNFKADVSASRIEEILEKHGLTFYRQYGGGEVKSFLFTVTKSAGKNPIKVCNDLIEYPEVEYAEPNLINRFLTSYEPTDDLFRKQWHLQSENGIELVSEADVSATQAWDITRGSRDIVVAVIDDGFDISHPDLSDKLVGPKDFVDGDNQPFPTRSRGEFHGTPCAGVAIGSENGTGIVGVAPNCSFMPIRFDLAADDNLLWDIFDYTGKRADVISCSWGPVPVYAPLSSLLYNKFREISETGGPRGNGSLICFAAGNFNAPLNDPDNESFEWRHPSYGIMNTNRAILNGNAAHPNILAVSASNSQNIKSAYSNWGDEISVAAPSDNWHPIDPQQRMPGRGIWTTDNENAGLGFTSNSRYTGNFGGTSSATPLAAGIAALIRSVNPNLSAMEVKAILQETTDKIEDGNPDPVLGNRFGSYDQSGHSKWFGFGKVNALKAVQKALSTLNNGGDSVETSIKEGVFIVAALPNPIGWDKGRETVSFYNGRPEAINLSGWKLTDSNGKEEVLSSLEVPAGGFLTIAVQRIRLYNSGGTVRLENPAGVQVHEVSYTGDQAQKAGWGVKF